MPEHPDQARAQQEAALPAALDACLLCVYASSLLPQWSCRALLRQAHTEAVACVQVTLGQNAVASVPLAYNASSLAPGVYQGLVQITSNDPLLPVVNLTVGTALTGSQQLCSMGPL